MSMLQICVRLLDKSNLNKEKLRLNLYYIFIYIATDTVCETLKLWKFTGQTQSVVQYLRPA